MGAEINNTVCLFYKESFFMISTDEGFYLSCRIC